MHSLLFTSTPRPSNISNPQQQTCNGFQHSTSNRVHTWNIDDPVLPDVKEYDVFDEWINGSVKAVFANPSDKKCFKTGFPMHNTNNHRIGILKKSCSGVFECQRCKEFIQAAVSLQTRRSQTHHQDCGGLLVYMPCMGNRGHPVTHCWRKYNGKLYFEAHGEHGHPMATVKHRRIRKKRNNHSKDSSSQLQIGTTNSTTTTSNLSTGHATSDYYGMPNEYSAYGYSYNYDNNFNTFEQNQMDSSRLTNPPVYYGNSTGFSGLDTPSNHSYNNYANEPRTPFARDVFHETSDYYSPSAPQPPHRYSAPGFAPGPAPQLPHRYSAPGFVPGPAHGSVPGPHQGFAQGPAHGPAAGPSPEFAPNPAHSSVSGPPPGFPQRPTHGSTAGPSPEFAPGPAHGSVPGPHQGFAQGPAHGPAAGPSPGFAPSPTPPPHPLPRPVSYMNNVASTSFAPWSYQPHLPNNSGYAYPGHCTNNSVGYCT